MFAITLVAPVLAQTSKLPLTNPQVEPRAASSGRTGISFAGRASTNARRATPAAGSPLTIGSFKFNPDQFGDSLGESDGGAFRQQNWLNVVNADPGNPAALTGANFDTGVSNIGDMGQPTYTIHYDTPIVNGAGNDLGIVSARFSTNDSFILAVSQDGTTFSSFVTFGPELAIATGVLRSYFYGNNPNGPFQANLFVTPVDLSLFGVPAGGSVAAVMITSSPEGDLIRVAGFGVPISFKKIDGDAQTGVIANAVEKPLSVQISSTATPFSPAGKSVTFTVANGPAKSNGFAVGVDENATGTSYSTTTDASGVARAVLVLGSVAGSYTVNVTTPITGAVLTFTETGQKPDSTAILKDSPDIADLAPSYAVASDAPTTFYSVGLDAQGAKIGPMKCTWSTGGGGNPKTVGDGTVNSAQASSTKFTPTKVGQLQLQANPPISGVGTAKTMVYITRLYVSVDNTFELADPQDQRDKFVPGEYLDGTQVSIDVMEVAGQLISLHILTGPGAKGSVVFSVDPATVSHFPGIAMNYPINNPDTGPDLAFVTSKTPVTTGSSVKVNFDPSGDTSATLDVRDYGAHGTINVQMFAGKNTYSLPSLRLPVDNGSGLPMAGWYVGTKYVSTAGLSAAADSDDDNAAFSGQAGDGLSAFEEMRGFVTMGLYTRLDPRQRDVFFAMDPAIFTLPETPLARLFTLGPTVHFIDIDEVVGENYPPRNLIATKPVIDPNRAGVPGARAVGQRAVRIIDQMQIAPNVERTTYAGDVQIVPAYRGGIFGITITDLQDPGLPALGGTAQSPDETRSVEFLDQAHWNAGIHTNFSSGTVGYADGNGLPTFPCVTAGNPPNCDDFNLLIHMITPWQVGEDLYDNLHTVPSYPGDRFTVPGPYCSQLLVYIDGGFPDAQFQAASAAVIAHEVGHAVGLEHSFSCNESLMYYRIGDTLNPTVPYVPVQFTPSEKNGVRLWQ